RRASSRGTRGPRVRPRVHLQELVTPPAGFAPCRRLLPTSDQLMATVHAELRRLAALDRQQAEIVELKYFGGLTVEDIGEVLNTSVSTIKREWSTAKPWLRRYMRG